MRRPCSIHFLRALPAAAALAFFSCATAFPPAGSGGTAVPGTLTLPPGGAAGTGKIPPTPDLIMIMGAGLAESQRLADFLLTINPGAERDFAEELARIYTEEAAAEGVNHDVAFAQMCLETGFLRYGGLVTPEMNNFCGLGAIGPEQRGEQFSTPRLGVRAHIQHLKAYATEEPLQQALVDPRYRWVRYGSAPAVSGLAGTWAVDKEYGVKIQNILERLYLEPPAVQ